MRVFQAKLLNQSGGRVWGGDVTDGSQRVSHGALVHDVPRKTRVPLSHKLGDPAVVNSYYLSKPIKFSTSRANPDVNDGLWVVMMFQSM